MTQLSKNNFEILANHFQACKDFKYDILKCESTSDLVKLIEAYDDAIYWQLTKPVQVEVEVEVEVEVHVNPYLDDVVAYLKNNYLNKREKQYVMEALGADEYIKHDYRPHIGNSVINEMKLRLFFEMIDDISITEMEELYNKIRPGKVAVNQLSIAL